MTTNSSHLDMLAEAFGLSRLPKSVRDALLEEIDVIVFRSVLFRVMVNLDEDDKEELHDILEHAGDDFEKPYTFLNSKVKDFEKIVKDELLKVKNESLELVQQFA
ncbi:MAG: hypothetical protein WCO12_02605 [bacterium]